MSGGPRQLADCLNCGRAAPERYCAHCGQDTRERRAPFLVMLRELLQSFIAFDSVVLRSLPRLLFRPGRLTREYLEGRRASQVAPLRLYLFVSVLFFLFFSIPTPDASKLVIHVDDVVVGDADAEDRFDLQISFVPLSGPLGTIAEEQKARLQTMSPQRLVDRLVAAANGAIPKALILFVPLLALGLRMLFVFTRWLYFDHLVFALHAQSALFVALLLARLAAAPFPGTRAALFLVGIVVLAAPIHGFLAMLDVYPSGPWALVIRFALFTLGYVSLLGALTGVVASYSLFSI